MCGGVLGVFEMSSHRSLLAHVFTFLRLFEALYSLPIQSGHAVVMVSVSGCFNRGDHIGSVWMNFRVIVFQSSARVSPLRVSQPACLFCVYYF